MITKEWAEKLIPLIDKDLCTLVDREKRLATIEKFIDEVVYEVVEECADKIQETMNGMTRKVLVKVRSDIYE